MSAPRVEGPIGLKSKLGEILMNTVQLERYVTVGANQVRRRARVPVIRDEIDPELPCKVYEEFLDVCKDERLQLNDGPLKFEFWRQCLLGQARSFWDAEVAAAAGTTDNDFTEAITCWFAKYFDPTAFHDQKQYFLNATKAFQMSVKATANRTLEIVRYMRFMPGAPAVGTPIYSDVEMKMTLYRLMRTN